MKTTLLIISAVLLSRPLFAQTANAAPTVSTSTVTEVISSVPKSNTASYRLVYDPVSKRVIVLIYSSGITQTTKSIYTCTTYAQAQAFAATNAITGLPAQKTGQP